MPKPNFGSQPEARPRQTDPIERFIWQVQTAAEVIQVKWCGFLWIKSVGAAGGGGRVVGMVVTMTVPSS